MSWNSNGTGYLLDQVSFLVSSCGAARSVWFTIDEADESTSQTKQQQRKDQHRSSKTKTVASSSSCHNMTSDSERKSSSDSSVCPLRNFVLLSVIVSRLPGNSTTLATSLSFCLFSVLLWSVAVIALQHLRHGGDVHSPGCGPVKVLEVAAKFWHPKHRSNVSTTAISSGAGLSVSAATTSVLQQHTHKHGSSTSTTTPTWQLGPTFDPYLSTEDNYRNQNQDEGALCGKFVDIRKDIDYRYHKIYSCERQLFQDALVESMLGSTTSMMTDDGGRTCSKPERNWIVFTAGVMGAGKSYTIKQLHDKGRFPLDRFVAVDPDVVRQHFPEYAIYNALTPEQAGELTRKEAGVVSEILTEAALRRGQNVLVDGSLRNATWYQDLFVDLRTRYPKLQIGILHVTAPREAVFERAESRAQVTGRVVPRELLKQVMEEVPKSLKVLSKKVDFSVEISNPPDSEDVEIMTRGVSWDLFRRVWQQKCPVPSLPNRMPAEYHPDHGLFRAHQMRPLVTVPAA